MARLSYDSVEALIYDPVSANRTATRAALYSIGFRRTETVSTLEAMVESIQKSPPDIVLCEAQGAADELCAAIQQLRQGAAGHNPFIVIMVTAWEKSASLITKVVNSGADDLLLRPFSTALLGARIEAHIDRRKSFVITTEYVGPDRRREPGRNSADLFEPPNSLKMKAKEKLTADAIAKRLDGELRTARDKLTTEKLRRDSFQVCILWRLMQEQAPGAPTVKVDLEKLSVLTRSIERRCRETEYDSAVEWCDSVLAATEGLQLGVDRNASMHLLGHAALNLHQIFHPETSPADQLNEIDATVAIIRARNQTAIASNQAGILDADFAALDIPAAPQALLPASVTKVELGFGRWLSIWWLYHWRLAAGSLVIAFFAMDARANGAMPVAIAALALWVPFCFLLTGTMLRKSYRGFRIALLAGKEEVPLTPWRLFRIWWLYAWRNALVLMILSLPQAMAILAAGKYTHQYANWRVLDLFSTFALTYILLRKEYKGFKIRLVEADG